MEDKAKLTIIPYLTAGFAVIAMIVFFLVMRDPFGSLGVFLGAFLAVLNFVFLTKMIVKFFDESYKRKSKLVLFFVLKMAVLVGVLLFAFLVLKVSVQSFAWGYMCLVAAMLVAPYLGAKKVQEG